MQAWYLNTLIAGYKLFTGEMIWWRFLLVAILQTMLYAVPRVRMVPPVPTRWAVLLTTSFFAAVGYAVGDVADGTYWVTYLMIVYFASCRPPKPPVRKHKLVTQT